MLRVAIQNSILVCLLILILHMMIRNLLIEKFPVDAPLSKPSATDVPAVASVKAAEDEKSRSNEADEEEQLELLRWASKDASDTVKPPPNKQTGVNMIISEYPHENVMNGGPVFTGLTGFDAAQQGAWAEIDAASSPLLPKAASKVR